MKVSGNLNAIQSSVKRMDLRLGFHRKKISVSKETCATWLERECLSVTFKRPHVAST